MDLFERYKNASEEKPSSGIQAASDLILHVTGRRLSARDAAILAGMVFLIVLVVALPLWISGRAQKLPSKEEIFRNTPPHGGVRSTTR